MYVSSQVKKIALEVEGRLEFYLLNDGVTYTLVACRDAQIDLCLLLVPVQRPIHKSNSGSRRLSVFSALTQRWPSLAPAQIAFLYQPLGG
jgi:hypothetical protein